MIEVKNCVLKKIFIWLQVKRIEHPVLYENYNNRRKLFSTGKKRRIGKVCDLKKYAF